MCQFFNNDQFSFIFVKLEIALFLVSDSDDVNSQKAWIVGFLIK